MAHALQDKLFASLGQTVEFEHMLRRDPTPSAADRARALSDDLALRRELQEEAAERVAAFHRRRKAVA